MPMEVRIDQSWKGVLGDEFSKGYFFRLTEFVKNEYKAGAVYPPPRNIFKDVSIFSTLRNRRLINRKPVASDIQMGK